MQVYEKSTFIRCDIEELFNFHLNTQNIKKITPPNIAVELLTPDIIPSEGKILKIKSTKNYIPINWEVRIDKLEKPHKLIDIAVKSPFKYWEHQHLFIQYEEFCELRDIVKFDMPFGILGDLFEPFVYGDLMKIFDYRHKVTKEILEKKEDN